MEGLFHKKLSLIRNDQDKVVGIAISGPITWGENEASARIGAVITQNGVEARSLSPVEVHFPVGDWILAAAVEDDVLHEGYATGEGRAEVRAADGSITTVSWTQSEIMLR
jgi:hypothetical protein